MLGISNPIKAGGENYYFTGAESYYLYGQDPGEYMGAAAGKLHLNGEVRPADLHALMTGFRPSDGAKLTQNSGHPNRTGAWDLCFSAPKEFSVFCSQLGGEERRHAEKCLYAALRKTLEFVEKGYGCTRTGHGSKVWEKAKLLFAVWLHITSRKNDPHYHFHCLLVNAAERQSGNTGAVHTEPIFKAKILIGTFFRRQLAHELENTLGIRVERAESDFQMGVPKGLCNYFSKRRQEILRHMEQKGFSGGKAATVSALATRSAKIVLPKADLFQAWRKEGESLGWGIREATALFRSGQHSVKAAQETVSEPKPVVASSLQFAQPTIAAVQPAAPSVEHPLPGVNTPTLKSNPTISLIGVEKAMARCSAPARAAKEIPEPKPAQAKPEQPATDSSKREGELTARKALRSLLRSIATDLSESQGQFTQALFQRRVLEQAPRGEPPAQLVKLGERFLRDSRDLHRFEKQGVPLFTTKDLYAVEKRIEKLVHRSKWDGLRLGRYIAYGIAVAVREKLLPFGRKLTDEQKAAVKHLAATRGRIKALSGIAGSGKSFTLRAARRVLEMQGFRVLGTAISAVAAENLEKGSGIKSRTFASLLLALEKKTITLDRKTVVVVDEAGMVGSRDMLKLLEAAQKKGARVLLVGDARQLQSIPAGGAFKWIGETLGQAELKEIYRQRADWEKKAVAQLAGGQTAKALKTYSDHGRLHFATDQKEACEQLVRDWKTRHLSQPEDTLILAGTRREVRTLNQMAQAARKEAGLLQGAPERRNEEEYYRGDRILFTQNDRYYGVKNGNFGTVTHVGMMGLKARLDSGASVSIPWGFAHVQLGYASTTHKAQGSTVESAFVLLGGAMGDRELTYVQASRAKGETHFYASAEGGRQGTAELASRLSASRTKNLSIDLEQTDSTTGNTTHGASQRDPDDQPHQTHKLRI